MTEAKINSFGPYLRALHEAPVRPPGGDLPIGSVLAAFAEDPSKALTEDDIIEAAGIDAEAAGEALGSLARLGLAHRGEDGLWALTPEGEGFLHSGAAG